MSKQGNQPTLAYFDKQNSLAHGITLKAVKQPKHQQSFFISCHRIFNIAKSSTPGVTVARVSINIDSPMSLTSYSIEIPF
jgi:hypothetical protein